MSAILLSAYQRDNNHEQPENWSEDIFTSPQNSIEENNNNDNDNNINNDESSKKLNDPLNFDGGDSEERQFSNYFVPIKILGRGAFGKVVMAEERSSGMNYAVKIIAKNDVSHGGMDKLMTEAEILSNLDHPNIVKFQRVFQSETKIFIVMELLIGGTLRNIMKERKKQNNWFSESEAAQIMHSILSAVSYFHSKSIVHRDLKPDETIRFLKNFKLLFEKDNILIGDQNDLKTVKIADFGLSAVFEAKKSISLTQQCGTLIYMAPEFFKQRNYSKPIDIWSCGIMMYQLLDHGVHPLYDPKKDTSKDFKKLIRSAPCIQFPPSFSEVTKRLIQKMTLIDPSSRYTANQVFSHPWIIQNPEGDVPLTMNEMFSTIINQSNFAQMNKALIFIQFLKKRVSNTPLVTSQYKDRLKRFSIQKMKEQKIPCKVDIYSEKYLNSIMDQDNNNGKSFQSDEQEDSSLSQSELDPQSGEIESNQALDATPSPYTNLIRSIQFNTPIYKKQYLIHAITIIITLNSNQQQGNKRRQTIQSSCNNIYTINNQSNDLNQQTISKIIPQFTENSSSSRKQNSFHKASIQQSSESSSPKVNNQNNILSNRKSQNWGKILVEDQEKKGSYIQPAFHIKLMNRNELNQQISRREKSNVSNSDQQEGNSPLKKNGYLMPPKKDTVYKVGYLSSGQLQQLNNDAWASLSKYQANSSSPIKRPSKANINIEESQLGYSIESGQKKIKRNQLLYNEDFSEKVDANVQNNISQQNQLSSRMIRKNNNSGTSECDQIQDGIQNNIGNLPIKNNSKSRQVQNASVKINSQVKEITKIIHLQKAQVAALSIQIHSLQTNQHGNLQSSQGQKQSNDPCLQTPNSNQQVRLPQSGIASLQTYVQQDAQNSIHDTLPSIQPTINQFESLKRISKFDQIKKANSQDKRTVLRNSRNQGSLYQTFYQRREAAAQGNNVSDAKNCSLNSIPIPLRLNSSQKQIKGSNQTLAIANLPHSPLKKIPSTIQKRMVQNIQTNAKILQSKPFQSTKL